MRGIESGLFVYCTRSQSVLALDGFARARETSISKKLTRYFVIREDSPSRSWRGDDRDLCYGRSDAKELQV